jgi:hypothetical protein
MKDTKRTWDQSPEGQAYRNQYRDNNYDRIEVAFPAGYKARLDAAAKAAGVTRAALIKAAVDEYIEKSQG